MKCKLPLVFGKIQHYILVCLYAIVAESFENTYQTL